MPKKLTTAVLVFAVCAAIIPLSTAPARAADDQQTISPGDILSITTLGEPELTKRVVVDAHGKVTLPMINEVQVGGFTILEATGKLRTALSKFIKQPQVTIEIAEAAKRQVVVSGAVKTPGVYELTVDSRLMTVLTQAGGYTPEADLTKITIARGAKHETLVGVDLTQFISGEKPENNVVLQPGDTIVVPDKNPAVGNVYVLGEVAQRGPVALRQGMTVREAIATAGGVTDKANPAKMTLKRGETESPIDYTKALAGDPAANVALQSGDTLYVPAVETLGTFAILGAVAKPGQYPVTVNMQMTDAVAVAGGASTRGDLSRVGVARTVGGKPQSLRLNLKKVGEAKAANAPVLPGDVISVGEKKEQKGLLKKYGWVAGLLMLFKP